MAYDPVLDAWIEAGKPTKEEIFEFLKANQESFNTDIEALKQTAQIDIIDTNVGGDINGYTQAELQRNLPIYKAPVTGKINSVVLTLIAASTSGTLQVDIEISTDNGVNWSTILTSPVEITGTTVGSISGAVNFINAASQEFDQNDLLRITLPGIQVDQGQFQVSIYGEVN
jgi:hypothetical protein